MEQIILFISCIGFFWGGITLEDNHSTLGASANHPPLNAEPIEEYEVKASWIAQGLVANFCQIEGFREPQKTKGKVVLMKRANDGLDALSLQHSTAPGSSGYRPQRGYI